MQCWHDAGIGRELLLIKTAVVTKLPQLPTHRAGSQRATMQNSFQQPCFQLDHSPNRLFARALMLIGLAMFVAISVGCQSRGFGGMGSANYGYNQQHRIMQPPVQPGFGQQAYGQQGFSQQPYGQQVIQQPPVMQQANGYGRQAYNQQPNMSSMGGLQQFGKNVGQRFRDGVVNRGINAAINGAIRMTGL
jgi:hypothetical protein